MAARFDWRAESWQNLKKELDRKVKTDELSKMKTLGIVKKTVAEGDLASIGSTLTLLETLERKNVVSHRKVDPLIEILDDIGRTDLALEVIKHQDKYYNYPDPDWDWGQFFIGLQESSQRNETCKNLYRGRVMLVGAYGAGKTSTKRSLFKEPYKTEHLSTDGADVFSIDITEWIIKESTTDYKGDKSIIETKKLLADVLTSGMAKDPSSGDIPQNTQKSTSAEVADVLNAVKLEGERITEFHKRLYRQLKEKRSQQRMRSKESDIFFNLWDFAGQSIYYITHQVFLASRVIYILATDLTKSLDDTLPVGDGEYWTVKQFLSFWMNSIHTHASQGSQVRLKQSDGSFKTAVAPPVIILGTKKDLLRQKNTTKDTAAVDIDGEVHRRFLEIEEYLAKHATQAVNAHLVGMIAIDNKSRNEDGTIVDPAVEILRGKIQELAKEYLFLGAVPAKWILLELSLRKLQKEIISLDEVKDLGKRVKMEEAEVIEALDFYHSVGELLYHKSVPELQNTVILDVVWLVSLFKILINQSIAYKDKLDVGVQNRKLIMELHYEGRLHDDLLDYLLQRHDRQKDKEILLKMMELHDIICEMPVKAEEKRMYCLPSLMQKDAKGKNSAIFPPSSSVCCQLYFHFIGNFLPEGLFYRLLIRCIRRWSDCVVVLRKHMARLYFPHDDFHLTLCKEDADIQLTILVIPASDQHPSPPQPKHVSNIRQLVEEDLKVVIANYTPTVTYHASLKCQCPNHKVGELLPLGEDVDDRCVPISEEKMTAICPRSALPLKDSNLNMWYGIGTASATEASAGTRAGMYEPLSYGLSPTGIAGYDVGWRSSESTDKVKSFRRAFRKAFKEQKKTTRNVQFTPADKSQRCFQLSSGFILRVPAEYPNFEDIETHVRCRETANGLSLEDYEFYQSDVIEFSPEYSVSGEPVRLMRKCLKLGPYDRVLQILRSNDGEAWHEMETTVEDGHVVALVTKLTMFVAISKPYQDRFLVDERAKVLTSCTNPSVSIEVPKNALEEETTIEMEVHNIDSRLLNDIYVSNNLHNVASVSPLVYVNRHMKGGKLHFKQHATLSIPLPPEMLGKSLDYTKLRIVKDELCNGDWRDVTGEMQHMVLDGVVRVTTDSLSGYLLVCGIVGGVTAVVAVNIGNTITDYLKSGRHSVNVLLLQDKFNDRLLLCDLIPNEQKNIDDPHYISLIKPSRSSTISVLSGDVVGSKLSQSTIMNFEMESDMNEHTYRPNDSNYWSITVSRNSNVTKPCEDLLGNMSFYKGEGSKLIAELPFISRGKKSTREARREVNDVDGLSELFYTLEENLTDDDTRQMINLLTPRQISRRDAGKLRSPYNVFRHLRDRNYVSEEDLELLKKIFRRMGRIPLVDLINEYLKSE